jgi:hypothetical protein
VNSSARAASQNELKAKLLLSDDTLLAEVGQSLGKGATATDAIRRGRQVLENLKRELKDKVCSNSAIIASYRESDADAVRLVGAIVDVIAGALHGIPPATVAVLIYRAGLATYCGAGWPPTDTADK